MRILILAIVALATIIGVAFFLGSEPTTLQENAKNAEAMSSTNSEKSWIEILSGKVFEFDKNGKLIRELKTGDIVGEERILDAGTGALASIYFGDGSILKIDSETKIEIQKNEFKKTNGKLVEKVWLSLGRVWSQIKNLNTADSEWQIETPNATAAAHGTSFGVEFTKRKSIVIVSENKVLVTAKDSETGEKIESSKTALSENEFVAIDEKDLPKIKAEKRTLKTEKVGSELLNRAWIKRAMEATPARKEVKNTTSPIELKITNEVSLEKIFEGESIKFDAVLVLSNGSEKTVSSEVTWQVLGGIGTIAKDGTFLPKLDVSVSEFGSAFGTIVAIWKDITTSKELLGKTPIFKVETRVIEEKIQNSLEPRG